MLMFLYGPDTFRSRQRLHQLKEGFIKKYDPSRTSIAVLDGTKVAFEEFRRAVMASGFLSPKRLIVVDGLIGGTKRTELQKQIVEFLDSTEWTDDNVLIFWEGDVGGESKTPKRPVKKTATKQATSRTTKPLLQRLSSEKHAEYFALLTSAELGRWIGQEVRRLGGSIQPAGVELLVSDVGPDVWRMSQEVAKLVAFRAGQPIRPEDVCQMVAAPHDDNIFHLTDAIADKNLKDTLRVIGELMASGQHELYILTMLVRQFRILAQVRDIANSEPHPATVASRLRLHPFVARRALSQAQKFSAEELADIYEKLVQLDLNFKTSQGNPRVLLDQFALAACR